MVAMATKYGYPIETHNVTTDDGYILTLFRIPAASNMGKLSYSSTTAARRTYGKPVVFCQHGLLDSSWTWLSNPPQWTHQRVDSPSSSSNTNDENDENDENDHQKEGGEGGKRTKVDLYEDDGSESDKKQGSGLGFMLADAGFDVWFGNNRGNRYSRAHTDPNLSPDVPDSGFWEFTWDDMAVSDLPAMLSYVRAITEAKTVGYVGHSEGTIQMLAAAAVAGAAADAAETDCQKGCFGLSVAQLEAVQTAVGSVNLFVALAPVAYVSHLGTTLTLTLACLRP